MRIWSGIAGSLLVACGYRSAFLYTDDHVKKLPVPTDAEKIKGISGSGRFNR